MPSQLSHNMRPHRGQRTRPLKMSSDSLQSGHVGSTGSSLGASSKTAIVSNGSMIPLPLSVRLYIIAGADENPSAPKITDFGLARVMGPNVGPRTPTVRHMYK